MKADPLSPRLARCQRALAASRDGFWERNLRTHEVWHSPSMADMLGRDALQQAGGIDLGDAHVHPDDRAVLRSAIDTALTAQGHFDFEARLRNADGLWQWMHARGQVWVGEDGRPEYLCGTLSNIDREKQAHQALAEQQRALEALVRERTAGLEAALALAEQRRQEAEAANAAKSRFLAHMSHEIRTPLNGVLGLTELSLATPLTPQQRRYLEVAHSSGQTLLQVISDVLDLSRIESGRTELRLKPFDAAQAMAETLRALMPVHRNPHVLLMFDWEGDACLVVGDEGCLRQVVGNLLGNAIKFTEQGQVVLRGRAQRQPGGDIALTIEVSDTGPGIPAEYHAQVFEPFVQVDNTLARGHGGAGLGLAIASRLAESMNAQLRLSSPPEGGTRFMLTLCLPAALAHPAAGALAAAEPAEPGLAWLVYPDQHGGHWLGARLARLGWHCRVLPSLQEALALARAPHASLPQLLLLHDMAVAEADAELRPLRAALPEAAIRLLVRPHWNRSAVEAEAGPLNIRTLVAPLTPDQLAHLALDQAVAADAEAERRHSAPDLQPQAEVLLVEDNPVNQMVGQEFLRSLGLSVRLADSGEAALAACIERAPQLVLMDLEMPGMDGLQAARRLRTLQHQGSWAGAPIVALTAHASAADRAACRAAGMDAVMTKPLSLGTLRKRLARWLAV